MQENKGKKEVYTVAIHCLPTRQLAPLVPSTRVLKPFGSDEMNLWTLAIVAASMISPLREQRRRGRFATWCSSGSSCQTALALVPRAQSMSEVHTIPRVSECKRTEGERKRVAEREGEERRGVYQWLVFFDVMSSNPDVPILYQRSSMPTEVDSPHPKGLSFPSTLNPPVKIGYYQVLNRKKRKKKGAKKRVAPTIGKECTWSG